MAIHRLTDLRVGTVTNLILMARRNRDGDVTDDDQAPAPRAGRPKPLGHHCLRFPGLTIELDSTMQSFMGARTEHLGFFENLCRDRQNYAPLFTAADRNQIPQPRDPVGAWPQPASLCATSLAR